MSQLCWHLSFSFSVYKFTLKVNQESPRSLFHLSLLFGGQASSGGYWQSVGLIYTDVSVVFVWIKCLRGLRQTEAIKSFYKWFFGAGNEAPPKTERSLILNQSLYSLGNNRRVCVSGFKNLTGFIYFFNFNFVVDCAMVRTRIHLYLCMQLQEPLQPCPARIMCRFSTYKVNENKYITSTGSGKK